MTNEVTILLALGGSYVVFSTRAVASAKAAIDISSTFSNWNARIVLYKMVPTGPYHREFSPSWEVSAIVPSTNGPHLTVVGYSDIFGGNFVASTSF